jgi:hypothetical protein
MSQSINYLNPITLLGAVIGETVELTKTVGEAILEAPTDFGRGFENNLFTDSPAQRQATLDAIDKSNSDPIEVEVVHPTDDQIQAEIERLQAMMSKPAEA